MTREDPQLKLRLTAEMKAKVTEAARASGRSVNAEITDRLEASFGAESVLVSTVRSLENIAEEMRYQRDVLRWMNSQQEGLIDLVEAIVAADGHIEPELLKAMREMVATKGRGNDFPERPGEDGK